MDRHTQGWALAGAVGGVAGGTAMTVMMTQVGPRVLPSDVLPDTPAPEKVVRWAEREAGQPEALAGKPKPVAALGAHLAYSAATGAAYGLARRAVPGLSRVPAPVAGVGFGLLVWVASFEGLLPALGVMPPTTAHPPKRWPAPLMGHSIFGAVTALVAARLQRTLTARL
jgi:uncharacterized membrane protein YagU involved in acid resistance